MQFPALILILVSLAGCTPFAKVQEFNSELAGFEVKARNDPLVLLDEYIGAAEVAWNMLDRNPNDMDARNDYNFAVARICASLRKTGLAPWKAPVRLGTHTLAWERDPHPERDPAKYEFIPADDLKITGKYMDVRETKAGLGAPMVAKRAADQLHELAPTPHFYLNVTATASFERSRCVISIDEPLEQENVSIGNHSWPLAADYTAPLAMMLVEMTPEDKHILTESAIFSHRPEI